MTTRRSTARHERLAAEEQQRERAPREPTQPPVGRADPRVASRRRPRARRRTTTPTSASHSRPVTPIDRHRPRAQRAHGRAHQHEGDGPPQRTRRHQSARVDRDDGRDDQRREHERERAPGGGWSPPVSSSSKCPASALRVVRKREAHQYTPERVERFRRIGPAWPDRGRETRRSGRRTARSVWKLCGPSACSPRTASYGSRQVAVVAERVRAAAGIRPGGRASSGSSRATSGGHARYWFSSWRNHDSV